MRNLTFSGYFKEGGLGTKAILGLCPLQSDAAANSMPQTMVTWSVPVTVTTTGPPVNSPVSVAMNFRVVPPGYANPIWPGLARNPAVQVCVQFLLQVAWEADVPWFQGRKKQLHFPHVRKFSVSSAHLSRWETHAAARLTCLLVLPLSVLWFPTSHLLRNNPEAGTRGKPLVTLSQ